jgi:hypothetical protein
MPNDAVLVRPETKAAFERLAREAAKTEDDIVAKAIEAYRRQRILDGINDDCAALRADPAAWSEEQEERAFWHAAPLR